MKMSLPIKKRELAAYFILYKSFGEETFNVGEALDVLSSCFSKKISLNIIKRLCKIGLIIKVSHNTYKVGNLEKWIESIIEGYLKNRCAHGSTSGGVSSSS